VPNGAYELCFEGVCATFCVGRIINIKCGFINYIYRVKYGIFINELLLKVSRFHRNVSIKSQRISDLQFILLS